MAENQHDSPLPAWIQDSSSQPLVSHSAAACTSLKQQCKNESAILGLYYTLAINRIKLQETVLINAYPPFSVSQLSLQRFLLAAVLLDTAIHGVSYGIIIKMQLESCLALQHEKYLKSMLWLGEGRK